MNEATTNPKNKRSFAITINRAVHWMSVHWALVSAIIVLIYAGLPWLAPIFMHWGWTWPAKLIYLIYTTQCHQMPQRSYFLFGEQFTYSLPEIQSMWQNTTNPGVLRQYIGDPTAGWKVAWSDRMVSMYSSILLWGAFFYPIRHKMGRLPIWGLFLFLLPMGLDGGTHMLSDLFYGIGGGFRDHNQWLAELTNNIFTPTFYSGDSWGSFNSSMRLLTGLSFGLGIVWWGAPLLHEYFSITAHEIERKFKKAGIPINDSYKS